MALALFSLCGRDVPHITLPMSELSDLTLLGFGASALFIVYLLRVVWGRRGRAKPARAQTIVIVDGSNVMHWGGDPSEVVLKRVIASLQDRGLTPYVIFDANVGYVLRGRHLADASMARMVGLPDAQVFVVESGVTADERILQVASENGYRVVSNDRFRDWTVKYPLVGRKGRILRGAWKSGSVVWRSL